MMDMHIVIYAMMYMGLGALVGFLSGLLGVGGGGILVPLLVSIFGYQGMSDANIVQMALGTSLACSLPTTATSAYAHHQRGAVLWSFVSLVSPTLILGSVLGILVATNIEGKYLALLFSLFMITVAFKMFTNWQPTPRSQPNLMLSSILSGWGIGLLSALISVGGAFVTLLYLSYNNIELKKAIGTSSAVGFIAVTVATLGYLLSSDNQIAEPLSYSLGYVYLPALVLVTLCSVLMVPVGAKVSHGLPNKQLKQILGVICVLLSVKLFYSTL